MTTIIVATKNAHKVREMNELLADLGSIKLITMAEAGLDAEIEENGKTFEENAIIKASFVAKETGHPSIADDSGLSVDVLGGEPGIYSARYASKDGGNATDDENIDLLLENMKNISANERTARFVSALALCFPDGRTYTAIGACEGLITRERRGEGGFGYDPVFFCNALSKTFGEASADEKNSVSHRNRAMMILREKMRDIEF